MSAFARDVSYHRVVSRGSRRSRRLKDMFTADLRDFGVVGNGLVDESAAVQRAVDSGARYLAGHNMILGLNSMVANNKGVTLDLAGTIVNPLSNTNLFRQHGGSKIIGMPKLDTSALSGWNSACIVYDGGSQSGGLATNFRLHDPTITEVECVGDDNNPGTNGTAILYLTEDSGVNEWLMGIHTYAIGQGFDITARMVCAHASRTFINSCVLEFHWSGARQSMVMESAATYGCDGNTIMARVQSRSNASEHTLVPWILLGQHNIIDFVQWDWVGGNTGTLAGMTLKTASRGNEITTPLDESFITNNSVAKNKINNNDTSAVTFSPTLVPIINDGAAFGSPNYRWSDSSWATGAVFDFGGDFFATHAAGKWMLSSAVAAATEPLRLTNTTDNAFVRGLIIEGDRANPAANDAVYFDMRLSDSVGTQTNAVRFTASLTTVTDAAEEAIGVWSMMTSGTLTDKLRLSTAALAPATTNTLTLGATGRQWGGLYLSSSGAVYVNNIQVLGAQGAAVSDALTGGSATAADCATQLNLLLARSRAHGLIAT